MRSSSAEDVGSNYSTTSPVAGFTVWMLIGVLLFLMLLPRSHRCNSEGKLA